MNRKRVDGIRHVTSEESNIFSELGFDDADAEQLRGQAEKEVEQLMALKRQLMQEIAEWIDEHQLKQADAAAKLSISRPRISDVVNQKTSKFTLDALVMMLMKLGKPVRLQIDNAHARACARTYHAQRLSAFLAIGFPDQYPASSEPDRLCQTENSAPGSAASGPK